MKQKSHSKGDGNVTNPERLFSTLYYLTGDKRGSAKQAWKCANDKIADNKAATTLNKPRVKRYLAKLAEDSQGSVATVAEQAKRVIDELAEISFFDIGKNVDALCLPDSLKVSIKNMGGASRAISKIEYEATQIPETEIKFIKAKIEFHNKLPALRMLGEHHQLYTQLVKHSGEITSPVDQGYKLPDNGMSREVEG